MLCSMGLADIFVGCPHGGTVPKGTSLLHFSVVCRGNVVCSVCNSTVEAPAEAVPHIAGRPSYNVDCSALPQPETKADEMQSVKTHNNRTSCSLVQCRDTITTSDSSPDCLSEAERIKNAKLAPSDAHQNIFSICSHLYTCMRYMHGRNC